MADKENERGEPFILLNEQYVDKTISQPDCVLDVSFTFHHSALRLNADLGALCGTKRLLPSFNLFCQPCCFVPPHAVEQAEEQWTTRRSFKRKDSRHATRLPVNLF